MTAIYRAKALLKAIERGRENKWPLSAIETYKLALEDFIADGKHIAELVRLAEEYENYRRFIANDPRRED